MSQPLLERLCSIDTLQTATDWLQSDCPQYHPDLGELTKKLQSGEYCFQPVTLVKTTNKLGETDTLEVWESQDRLVLKAMSLVLKDHLSDELSNCCHHLEGRGGIKKAVRKTREFVRDNPDSWVLKTDVKGYYAHIDHFILYDQLQSLISNEQYLLRLCWQYLKRTVYDGGNYYDRELGISLGSPLSPLMAALYLTPLDEAFEGQEWFYARFMDDWVIITPTRWKLRSAVEKVNMILNQHKLTKAYDKTFIGRSQKGFDFLGYHFTPKSLIMGKVSLQRRDARIHRLYEQGADSVRVGEYVSRWQQWAKAGLQGQLTETEEFHNVPRQADSGKLPLEAKFLALGVASVLSTAAFDSHATIYQVGTKINQNKVINFTTPLCAPDIANFSLSANVNSNTGTNTSYTTAIYTLRVWAAIYSVATKGSWTTSYQSLKFFSLNSFTQGSVVNNFNNQLTPSLLTLKCSNCSEPAVVWMRIDVENATSLTQPNIVFTAKYGVADSSTMPSLANTTGLTDNPNCNTPPTAANTATNQAVNDNASIAPFSGVTLTDADTNDISVTITLDDNAKGTLSVSTINSDAIASVQTALQAVTFTPTANRVAVGDTETTTFTITVNDGTVDTVDSTTTVVSTSINDIPSFTKGANQSVGAGTNTQQTVNGWATNVDDGGDVGSQTLTFNISTSGDSIFTTDPAIDSSGNLTYTPNGTSGTATVSVAIHDDGGTANSGVDTSSPQTFTITVNPQPVLSLSANPASVIETAGSSASTVTVTRNGDTSADLVVTLTGSDDTEATVPANVTILAGQTTATFDITAVDDSEVDGSQTVTITASATGFTNGTTDITVTDDDVAANAPNAPTSLTATATSQTQIDLAWIDNSSDETGFKIEQPAGTLINTTVAAATSYSHTGLTCETTYSYEVKATNDTGDSTSITGSATTEACSITPEPTPEPSTGGSSSSGGATSLPPTMDLIVSMEGNGTGNVTTTPSGIDCDTVDEECKNTFETASWIELIAEPDNGSEFSSWRGHSYCVDGKVFLSGNRFCDAVFKLLPVPEIYIEKTAVEITEGGGADSYSMWLNTKPKAPVTITLDANDADTHNGRKDISLNTNELVFNETNWEQPQTVEVFHQDENVADGAHEHLIQHRVTSEDSDYNGMTLEEVSVQIMDNDSAGIHISTYDIHIKEGEAGAHYSIMLLTQPQSEVTFVLKTDSEGGVEPDKTLIKPTVLTFTPDNWNVPQDVIVSVNDDTVPEGTHDHAPIYHTVTSDDSDYDGFAINDVQVHISDNDVANLDLSLAELFITEGETNNALNLALTVEPTSVVSVNLIGSIHEHLKIVPQSLSFDGTNWNQPQTVLVSVLDDDSAEGQHIDAIRLSTQSNDPNYDTLFLEPITVNITDNDAAGITLSIHQVTVFEEGENDSYTMSLTTQPIQPVEIYLTTSAHTQVDKDKLTFTPNNWNLPQTISVSAVDDDLVEGEDSHLNTIMHTVRSDDPNYNGLPLENVTVQIVDSEEPIDTQEPITQEESVNPITVTPDETTTSVIDEPPSEESPSEETPTQDSSSQETSSQESLPQDSATQETPSQDTTTGTINSPTVIVAQPPICPLAGDFKVVCNVGGEVVTDLEVHEGGDLSAGVVETALTNRGRVSNLIIRQTGSVTGGTVTGLNYLKGGLMSDFEFVGYFIDGSDEDGEVVGRLSGQIKNSSPLKNAYFKDVRLDKNTQIQGSIILKGHILGDEKGPATLNAVIIHTGTHVANVVIEKTVIIKQNATLENATLQGLEVEQVTLSGRVQNTTSGIFRNIKLGPDAHISGGTFLGTIAGDPESPALIEFATIPAGTRLSHVIIGNDVVLEEGVILGDGVEFVNPPIDETETQEEETVTEESVTEAQCDDSTSSSTAITLDSNETVKSSACFTGQLEISGEKRPNRAKLSKKDAKKLKVSLTINPFSGQVGSGAKILIVGLYQAANGSGAAYCRHGKDWQTWDGEVGNLTTAEDVDALPENLEVQIFDGDLSTMPGSFTVYVGIQLQDGTIHYNSGGPVQFEVE